MAKIKGIWKLRQEGAMPIHSLSQAVNFPSWSGNGDMMKGITFRKFVPSFSGQTNGYGNSIIIYHEYDSWAENNRNDTGIYRIFPLGDYDPEVSDSVTWANGEMPDDTIMTLDFGTDGQEVSQEFYDWVQKNMIEQPRSIKGTWHMQKPCCGISYWGDKSYSNPEIFSLNFTDVNGKEYVGLRYSVDDLGWIYYKAIDTEDVETDFITFPHGDPTITNEIFDTIKVMGSTDPEGALQFLVSVYNKEPIATFDLSTLGLSDQNYAITAIAKADNYTNSLASSIAEYNLAEEETEFTGHTVSITNTADDAGEILVYDGITTATLLGTVPAGATVDFTVMGEYICLQGSGGTWEIEKTTYGVYGSLDFDEDYVYAVTSNGAIVGKASKPIDATDELAGTWVFTSTLGVAESFYSTVGNSVSVAFSSNSRSFTAISARMYDDNYNNSLWYDSICVLGDDGTSYASWTNSAYKTIIITSNLSEVTNGDALLTWLKANATKQTESQTESVVGTWTFNDSISYLEGYHYVDFTSNGTNFIGMGTDYEGNIGGDLVPADVYLVYLKTKTTYDEVYADGWENNAYKTINITSEPTDTAFIEWLKANATKQSAANLITFTIDGTSYQAEQGMTWGEWVESEYSNNEFWISGDNVRFMSESWWYISTEGTQSSRVSTTDNITSGFAYVHYDDE